MDIPEYLPDILLTAVMVISTLVLILRFWQDLIIAVAAALMMLSLGGLFLVPPDQGAEPRNKRDHPGADAALKP